MAAAELAGIIDHTLLAPEATPDQVDALCDEALRHGFGAVCVNPIYVRRVVGCLAVNIPSGTGSRTPSVVSVAGFPLGASSTATKADEARRAMDEGAIEVDMVVALGPLINGDDSAVTRDIEAVANVAHGAANGGVLKVILETTALTTEQVILGCRCCREAAADFVKTSTGFHASGGATVEHVKLLCRHAAPLCVKAAGGIRTAAAACALVDAGASRLGTSAGVAIIEELRRAVC